MWRPFHMIGLETSVSVLSAILRGEPTGTPKEFRGDAVATAKRDLFPGEVLDDEGGYTVWAKAIPAALPSLLVAANIALSSSTSAQDVAAFERIMVGTWRGGSPAVRAAAA